MGFSEDTVLNDRYQFVKKLGVGSFAEVWLAKDSLTLTEVALKIFAPVEGLESKGIEEFRKEYVRLKNFSHPHLLIPEHFDIVSGTQSPFVILPYCSEGTLTSHIVDDKPVDEALIAQLMSQIGSGLQGLHERDLIHQAVNPDNILIHESGAFMLNVFGTNRNMRSTLRQAASNPQHQAVAYSPPERFIANPVDSPAGDIFSFGVVLYELCTGQTPWEGMGGMVLNNGAEVPNLPDSYAPELNEIVRKCLHKDYKERPSAKELAEAGADFLFANAWRKTNSPTAEAAPQIPTPAPKVETKESRTEVKTNQTTPSSPSKTPKQKLRNKAGAKVKPIYLVAGVFTPILLAVLYWGFVNFGTPGEKDYENAMVLLENDDSDSAFVLLEKSALSGYAKAQNELGERYNEGDQIEQDYDLALKWFRMASDQGDPLGHYNYGDMFYHGNGVEQNYDSSMVWFLKAVDSDDPPAWAYAHLGDQYYFGYGVETDYTVAYEWYEKSAQLDEPYGQFKYGSMTQTGQGVEKDEEKAFTWLLKAAEGGNASSMNWVASAYFNALGTPENQPEAFKWYMKSANEGNSVAQYSVGVMYQQGLGVEADDEESFKWLLKAAEQGSIRAMNVISEYYLIGKGVQKDDRKAFEWARKSAISGDPQGQLNLGVMYVEGNGVNRNTQEAFKWVLRAAEQNHVSAMNRLALFYFQGTGTASNYAKAFEWSQKSARTGDPVGQYNLGFMYEYGYGVSANLFIAKRWYQKSADQGYQDSIDKLKALD